MPRGRRKRCCRSTLPPRGTAPLIGAAVTPALLCSAGKISAPALHLWLVIAAHAWQGACDLTNAALSAYLPDADSERRVAQLLAELARAGLLEVASAGSERTLQPLVPELAGNPISGKLNFPEIPHDDEDLNLSHSDGELHPHEGDARGNFAESQFPGNPASPKLPAFLVACGVFPQTAARHLATLLRRRSPDEIARRALAHLWQLAQEGIPEAQRGGLLVYRLVESDLDPPPAVLDAAQQVLPALAGWEPEGDARAGIQTLLERMSHARYGATASAALPAHAAFVVCAPLVANCGAHSAQTVWREIRTALGGITAQEVYRLHFAGAQPLGFVPDDAGVMAQVGLPAGTLVVQAASAASLDWIRCRLHKLVARASAQAGVTAPVFFVAAPFAADMPPQFTQPDVARRVWSQAGLAGASPLGFNGDGTTLVLYPAGALDLAAVNASLPAPYRARWLNLAAGDAR